MGEKTLREIHQQEPKYALKLQGDDDGRGTGSREPVRPDLRMADWGQHQGAAGNGSGVRDRQPVRCYKNHHNKLCLQQNY